MYLSAMTTIVLIVIIDTVMLGILLLNEWLWGSSSPERYANRGAEPHQS